jgi:P4 family phage/plasmid primase-like protien
MTAPRHISEAELQRLKDDNPCDVVAAKWVALRKHGRKMIGPCPIHSPDSAARDSTSFECDGDGWVCAVCHDGGDVIKLVQKVENLEFLAAVDWLGGVQKVDAAEETRREEDRRRKKAETEKNSAIFREKERGRVFDIWRHGSPIGGTDVEAYLALRGLSVPPAMRMRCIPAMPYYANGKRDAAVIHRGPAMLVPIIGRDGKFAGLHITYVDLGAPKGKAALQDPESGELLPAKKVRGSKAGGRLELVVRDAPRRLVIGEGIEKAIAVWRALEHLGRDLSETAFWTSVDLGNLGGKSAESVPHPILKTAAKRTAHVPGPDPDLASPGIPVPDSVEEVVILGDATSDRFLTECAIARAAARWARPGRRVAVAWCWTDADFDDVLRLEQLDTACARIAGAFDAATPVERPSIQAPQPTSQTKSARKGRPLPSPVGADAPLGSDPPDAVRAPRTRPPVAQKIEAASQAGASPDKPATAQGAGRGHGGDGEDPDEINRRLAWFPLTDLGNAERFVERQRGKLMYCQAIGWLWWDHRRWSTEGADQVVRRAEHDTVRAIQKEAKALAAQVAAMDTGKRSSKKDAEAEEDKTAAKGKARRKMMSKLAQHLAAWGRKSEANSKMVPIHKNAEAYLAVSTAALDADPLKINVHNGTLLARREWTDADGDYRSWPAYGDYIRLKPHDPADLITKLAPVAFEPTAKRSQFDTFIQEVQPDGATRRFLQAWKGYSLTADASEHRMAIFIGKGRNGKSVFEDCTAHVAGDYAETVPIETFLASGREANANAPSPARALLHNARMVRTSEPNKGAALDEGFIKLVTGGEPIQARNLNLPLFRFYPVLKLTVSGNHRPKIGGTDEGIWSRVTLVPWPVIIPPEKRDRKLTEKLRGEASGILNWMLDGLSDWIEHGLILPEEVRTATAEYRRDSDQLGRFLELAVLVDPEGRVQSSVLLTVFNAWARVNGGTEWTGRGLANAMTERGFRKDKSSVMFWLGIRLTKSEGDFDLGGSGGGTNFGPSHRGSSGGGQHGHGDEMTF